MNIRPCRKQAKKGRQTYIWKENENSFILISSLILSKHQVCCRWYESAWYNCFQRHIAVIGNSNKNLQCTTVSYWILLVLMRLIWIFNPTFLKSLDFLNVNQESWLNYPRIGYKIIGQKICQKICQIIRQIIRQIILQKIRQKICQKNSLKNSSMNSLKDS